MEKLEKDKTISEDECTKLKDKVQKLTDGCARTQGLSSASLSVLILGGCAAGADSTIVNYTAHHQHHGC